MAKLFHELRERLLTAGIAPRHVRRYLSELNDHLADLIAEEQQAGRSRTEAESAALARLGSVDDLAQAMTTQPHFQSWSARAPWAIFAVAPLIALCAAYFVACLILWSGWKIFLPDATTPFISVYGLAVFFFGIGRSIYFGAPILVGWAFVLLAVRRRLHVRWPVVGLVLLAVMGGTARVHVNTAAQHMKHVGMSLDLQSYAQRITFPGQDALVQLLSPGLLHTVLILALTMLPYFIWQKTRSQFA